MAHRGLLRQNAGHFLGQVTIDPASIAASTTGTTLQSINGVKGGGLYLVAVDDDDLDAGLIVQSVCYCETDGILPVRIANVTAAPIDMTAAILHVIGI